jgi:hypothetical protein
MFDFNVDIAGEAAKQEAEKSFSEKAETEKAENQSIETGQYNLVFLIY